MMSLPERRSSSCSAAGSMGWLRAGEQRINSSAAAALIRVSVAASVSPIRGAIAATLMGPPASRSNSLTWTQPLRTWE